MRLATRLLLMLGSILLPLTSTAGVSAAVQIKTSSPQPVSGTVTVTATATGVPRLGQVVVSVDGAQAAACPKSPCAFPWNTANVADGVHTIQANALNTGGKVRGSGSLSVAVINQTPSGGGPTIAGCPVFPADNAWNTDISALPVHPNSANFLASIGSGNLHPDWGDVYGIPYTTVPGDETRYPMTFHYADQSDPGPYPIPPDAPIEPGSDRHVLALDRDDCMLYEVYAAHWTGSGWSAGSGAIWDFKIDATRPAGWTSADAAGLPILPGLVRYDEVVQKGAIEHAVRFTVSQTQHGYVAPASHFASGSTNPNLPPMGLRLRLKAGFDVSGFHPQIQVILRALKTYGMIVADNGSSWYITGELNPLWDNTILDQLKTVGGANFEVVYTGEIVTQ
jgi:Bacterial Ig domain